MNRARIVIVVAAFVLAACGGGGDGDDMAAGPSPTTTAAGMGAGGEHVGHDGTGAACTPSGSNVSIVASATRFNTDCLAAPAGQPFTLALDNRDPVGHNIAILASHNATEVLYRADIFSGPRSTTFSVPALSAGTYVFHCEVHPSAMQGTFVVA